MPTNDKYIQAHEAAVKCAELKGVDCYDCDQSLVEGGTCDLDYKVTLATARSIQRGVLDLLGIVRRSGLVDDDVGPDIFNLIKSISVADVLNGLQSTLRCTCIDLLTFWEDLDDVIVDDAADK